jgi:hypothetical protein
MKKMFTIIYFILNRPIWKSNICRAGVSCLLIVFLVALVSVVIVAATRHTDKPVSTIEGKKG